MHVSLSSSKRTAKTQRRIACSPRLSPHTVGHTTIWEGRANERLRMRFRSNFMPPKRRFWKELMVTKRRFWKAEQKMKSGFSKHFSMVRSPNRVLTPKGPRKSGFHLLFVLPKSSCGDHRVTKDEVCVFEALFNCEYSIWQRTIEKHLEKAGFIFCSVFPNLRLGTTIDSH